MVFQEDVDDVTLLFPVQEIIGTAADASVALTEFTSPVLLGPDDVEFCELLPIVPDCVVVFDEGPSLKCIDFLPAVFNALATIPVFVGLSAFAVSLSSSSV